MPKVLPRLHFFCPKVLLGFESKNGQTFVHPVRLRKAIAPYIATLSGLVVFMISQKLLCTVNGLFKVIVGTTTPINEQS